MIFIFGPHCSCPNGLVTSNMAPAHPHATSVAVYPALFNFPSIVEKINPKGRFFDFPEDVHHCIFRGYFLEIGDEIEKSPWWRKLYLDKLQNDTPHDPVEVVVEVVVRGVKC